MQKDDEEDVAYDKSMHEYHISLASSEGAERVQKILDKEDKNTVTDENFDETMKDVFGRQPGKTPGKDLGLEEKDLDVIKVIKKSMR